ncbi:uncharacterized protein LOC129594815 [Paramacrobiotus metropolitanus]|uniref:uncharacterized protein LOC129594815 n=1 Tax=Paramacrobiotus metropolitanus TaxID=2943436 RepID=UPI002445AF1F|nr:uncharacterized protein LOC129594815 [Paramacrobiotus metropolitanus]
MCRKALCMDDSKEYSNKCGVYKNLAMMLSDQMHVFVDFVTRYEQREIGGLRKDEVPYDLTQSLSDIFGRCYDLEKLNAGIFLMGQTLTQNDINILYERRASEGGSFSSNTARSRSPAGYRSSIALLPTSVPGVLQGGGEPRVNYLVQNNFVSSSNTPRRKAAAKRQTVILSKADAIGLRDILIRNPGIAVNTAEKSLIVDFLSRTEN